jgi:hypothetical protein
LSEDYRGPAPARVVAGSWGRGFHKELSAISAAEFLPVQAAHHSSLRYQQLTKGAAVIVLDAPLYDHAYSSQLLGQVKVARTQYFRPHWLWR